MIAIPSRDHNRYVAVLKSLHLSPPIPLVYADVGMKMLYVCALQTAKSSQFQQLCKASNQEVTYAEEERGIYKRLGNRLNFWPHQLFLAGKQANLDCLIISCNHLIQANRHIKDVLLLDTSAISEGINNVRAWHGMVLAWTNLVSISSPLYLQATYRLHKVPAGR